MLVKEVADELPDELSVVTVALSVLTVDSNDAIRARASVKSVDVAFSPTSLRSEDISFA